MVRANSKNELKKIIYPKIKIDIEWEGHSPDKNSFEKAYEANEICNFLYPFDEVESSLKETLQFVEPELRNKYDQLSNGLAKIRQIIDSHIDKMIDEMERRHLDIENLSEGYLKRSAEIFIKNNKRNLVVIAPDLWLPHMKKNDE